MSVADKLKKAGLKLPKSPSQYTPLWTGPCGTGPQGGITQGLLGRYMTCKERFRILTIEGWKPADHFNHRLEYGNLWHICEEAFAAGREWEPDLLAYCKKLAVKYRNEQEDVQKWYNVCKTQFPYYVEYWKNNHDVVNRTPIFQELKFDISFTLPSSRVIRLRGKWDSVDIIDNGIYLQENKTKGDINEIQIKRQLSFDLQTMIYLIALEGFSKLPNTQLDGYEIKGVRYNVIRRPLSGGKGTIVRHKAKGNKPEETEEHYYGRLSEIIRESPQEYFMRWPCQVFSVDIEKFKNECLIPELENLCDDFEWWEYCKETGHNSYDFSHRESKFIHTLRHSRRAFGVYDVLAEGGTTDLDSFLASGSTVGLERATTLFPELEDS